MSWFDKLLPSKIRTKREQSRGIPEGLWSKCSNCSAFLFSTELEKNLFVCPKCSHHQRIGARKRLELFLDTNDLVEIAQDVIPEDRLKFRDTKKYKDRIIAAQKETNEIEALVAMSGYVQGLPVVAAAFEFGFIGGSMGAAVGERFYQAVMTAINKQVPFICFATSGGARMQEGLFSLMQMPKTSAALALLSEKSLPYISVLVDPCMGGVSASLAMLGDVIIAEPKALIGFAGPRVIEQTLRESLPEGFQRSEYLLNVGAVDMIVERQNLRSVISSLISKLQRRTL